MSRRHVWKERAVNTRYLKEFLVIAEELNFSAAAKRLYTTRPTLSEHLAELEDELGYSRYDYRNKATDNSRNGHSDKTLRTSFGDVEVSVPRDRKGD